MNANQVTVKDIYSLVNKRLNKVEFTGITEIGMISGKKIYLSIIREYGVKSNRIDRILLYAGYVNIEPSASNLTRVVEIYYITPTRAAGQGFGYYVIPGTNDEIVIHPDSFIVPDIMDQHYTSIQYFALKALAEYYLAQCSAAENKDHVQESK